MGEYSAVLTVAPAGEGLIAFSMEGDRPETDLWHSPDGRTWESITPHGDPVESAVGVVAADERLLAFGNVGGEEVRAAFWTSEDGVTWHRAQADFDGGQVTDVAAGAGSFVAVGGVDIWTSSSGEMWERVAHGGQFDDAFLWAVTQGGPGFVAVGWREERLAVWTSVTGREWALAPDPQGSEGFEGLDIVERDRALVIVAASSPAAAQARGPRATV